MAKSQLNPILKQLRGRVGDLVFRHYGDKVVVSRAPDFSNYRPTPAQRAQRKRFRAAVAYAQAVLKSTKTAAHYQRRARKEGGKAFTLAIRDYMRGKDLRRKPQ